MIVLALDISTHSTGIAIYNQNKLIHYECAAATSTNVFNRIDKITAQIEALLDQYKIDTVVAEAPLPAETGHNMNTYQKLTWAQGIIGDMLNRHKLKYDQFYTSSQWRAKVGVKTGRGIKRQSLKPKDIAKAKELYGIDVNDDIADAILIGKAYVDSTKKELNWE